jgi:hypothetical protein
MLLYPVRTRNPGRALAWSALMAITIMLAWLLQAVATSATVGPAVAAESASGVSAATAALANGDDVRARFLVSFAGAPVASSVPSRLLVART